MPTPSRATIGLCMIVKDEAAVIERCLRSVIGLIDNWTICDTGSADATRTIIADTLAGVPGQLYERPWRDFGANRTELMALAHGTADYLLLLDADMTLRGARPAQALDADAYRLRHDGDLEYWIPRLVRGDRRWRYEGATHEYLTAEEPFDSRPLDELVVEHHADGGSRADKLERDRRLLGAQLEHDPDDVRAIFYLAQTLRDSGDAAAAIELYRRRAQLGGWDEEVYYAAYQAGLLIARDDIDAAIPVLVDAAQRRPRRGEALYELARLSRAAGRHEDAYAYARRGADLVRPDDVLFVHGEVYEWGLLYELSVAAYWVGDAAQALALSDRLLASGRLPWPIECAVRENRRYCIDALDPDARPALPDAPAPLLSSLAAGAIIGEITLDVDPPWAQFNPSIAADRDGFRAIVRTANYRLVDGRYVSSDDGVVRTLNYLVHLDRALNVERAGAVVERVDGPPRYPTVVQGYEDLRLVAVGDRWFATATACDRNPRRRCEMVLLELADNADIVRAQLLEGPDPQRHEKNWMPFVVDGRLLLVYSVAPTVVFACDVDSGRLTAVSEHAAPQWARELRGGSPGLPVAGGRLFVVHEVIHPDRPRIYVHRFVLLDDALRLVAVSPRFSFTGAEIEMCLGLAARGEELLMTFGVHDGSAHVAIADREAVLDTLVWLA
jgi:tetratricopeptide (TPR) repeat protein/predicted GH43/DUF377 family glycosyl hydrolase